MAKEKFPDWDRNPRPPVPLPPRNSCDCQVHVYGDPKIYPPKLSIGHELPDASFADAQRVLKVLGFDRAVLVHPGPYDTDHRLLVDTLEVGCWIAAITAASSRSTRPFPTRRSSVSPGSACAVGGSIFRRAMGFSRRTSSCASSIGCGP